MSKYRINIIAALSAIALCAGPSLTAQTSSTQSQGQDPTTSTSSSTDATSTRSSGASNTQRGSSTTATDDPAASASSTTLSPSSTSTRPSYESTTTPSSQATSSSAGSTIGSQSSFASSMTSGQVTRATDDAENSSVGKLKGKRITGSGGNEIGKIHDFIIDGGSGEIAHVVVSSGGLLGIGDKLRLVKRETVKQSGSEFTSDMQESDFKALPTISSADLEAGRFTATQQSSSSIPSDAASTSLQQGQLFRASSFEDKSLRSDNTEVGEVEHIVVDLQSGKAMALVDVNAGFVTSGGKFLVPFNKLEVGSGATESITTSLLRSDFPMQQTSSTGATSSSDSVTTTSPGTSAVATGGTSAQPSTTSSTSPSSTASTSASSTPSTSTPSSTATRQSGTSGTSAGASGYDASTASGVATTTPATSTAGTSDTSSSTTDRSISASSANTASSSSASSTPSTSTYPTAGSTETPGSSSSDLASSRSRTGTSSSPSDTASADRTSPATADTAITSGVTATDTQSSDQQLTPTGRTSFDQSPASSSTAMAIRQAIDSDSTLAQEDVQVTTKVVLRGSVESEEAKKRVEEMAKKAAGSAEIDNQITVKQK